MQIEKGGENFQEVLGKFYFKFEKVLDKICEILEETLKRLWNLFNSFIKHNIKNN